jgi:hypothetical protein
MAKSKQASRGIPKRAGSRQAKIAWHWENRHAPNKAKTYARSLRHFARLMLRSVKKGRRGGEDAVKLIKATADRLHNYTTRRERFPRRAKSSTSELTMMYS